MNDEMTETGLQSEATRALDDLGELIDQLAGNAREFDYNATNRMERDAAKALLAIEAALTQPAAVKDGWQPIETAPRDGTQILACAQLSEHLTAAIISSQGHLPDLSIVKWDDREKDFIAMADGYMSIASQGDTWTTYHEPYVTHWMPLPIPPATLKEPGQ